MQHARLSLCPLHAPPYLAIVETCINTLVNKNVAYKAIVDDIGSFTGFNELSECARLNMLYRIIAATALRLEDQESLARTPPRAKAAKKEVKTTWTVQAKHNHDLDEACALLRWRDGVTECDAMVSIRYDMIHNVGVATTPHGVHTRTTF